MYDPGSQTLIDAAPWDVTDEFHIIPGAEPDLFMGDRWMAPVIAIPVQRKAKDSFAFPSSHLDYLRETIPEVTRLLIIGWAGRENHFHDLWKGAGTRVEQLVVVAGSLTAGEDLLKILPVGLQNPSRSRHAAMVLVDEAVQNIAPAERRPGHRLWVQFGIRRLKVEAPMRSRPIVVLAYAPRTRRR